jgi:formylglycine-generating enzyme required for sulfatase activity
MEWQYACQADTITRFFWGNAVLPSGKYVWDIQDSNDHPHSVGQKSPNPWGFYDMLGNVAEWCDDAWTPGPIHPNAPLAPRAACGGSFLDEFNEGKQWIEDLARDQKRYYIGFRLGAGRTSKP